MVLHIGAPSVSSSILSNIEKRISPQEFREVLNSAKEVICHFDPENEVHQKVARFLQEKWGIALELSPGSKDFPEKDETVIIIKITEQGEIRGFARILTIAEALEIRENE